MRSFAFSLRALSYSLFLLSVGGLRGSWLRRARPVAACAPPACSPCPSLLSAPRSGAPCSWAADAVASMAKRPAVCPAHELLPCFRVMASARAGSAASVATSPSSAALTAATVASSARASHPVPYMSASVTAAPKYRATASTPLAAGKTSAAAAAASDGARRSSQRHRKAAAAPAGARAAEYSAGDFIVVASSSRSRKDLGMGPRPV
mmetsp:Transcript_21208/g.80983  ORF Transcript_21208/g.80983 Transcript_21208/m.80983 type:complete len:207 (+) Transcript_21208:1470-2090(+)